MLTVVSHKDYYIITKMNSSCWERRLAARQGTGCFRSSKMRREVDAKVLLPCHYWTAFHVDELIDIARMAQREQCVSRCFPTVGKSLRCLPSWQVIIHFMNHFISQATYHLSRIAKRGVCYTKWAESCHNGKYYDHFSTIEKLLCGQCRRHAKIRRKLTI